MNITVFQALSLLLDHYKNDEAMRERISPIYLRGVETPNDGEFLEQLLADDCLAGFTIDDDVERASDDPSRRYFESLLMLESIKESVDELDITKLRQLYQIQFKTMDEYYKTHVPETVFKNRDLHVVAGRDLGEEEYAKTIADLKSEEGFQDLKPSGLSEEETEERLRERKKKLVLILKAAFCAVVSVQLHNDEYPIAIYFQQDGPFAAQNRGRQWVGNRFVRYSQQVLRSQYLGTLKTYMPLYRDSPLLADKPFNYAKPTDLRTYVLGSEWLNRIAAKKVVPFINSVSGTLLMELRMSKKLLTNGNYPYEDDPVQLKLFYKLYIAVLLFTAGGHSLEEWAFIFKIPEIQDAFQDLAGFSELTLEEMFLRQGSYANACNETIDYTKAVLSRQEVNMEINGMTR